MVQTSTAHSERINLRLSETAKRCIEQTTSVEGKTVGAFIVSSAPSALATVEKTRPSRGLIPYSRVCRCYLAQESES